MLTLTNLKTNETISIGSEGVSVPAGFVHENGSYRFEFATEAAINVSLLISDEEQPISLKEKSPEQTRLRWDWYVEEYAGEVIVSLIAGQQTFLETALDIAPNPYKLGSEVYQELLLDLQEKAEGVLFGKTPAQSLLQHQDADVPPLARFALVRSYFTLLERAFRTIQLAPHRNLVAEREERQLHKVRRVDTQSLRTTLKRMPVLAALKNRENPIAGKVTTLDVPRRVHSFDTSPNRHTLALLLRLIALCADLLQRFESIGSSTFEEPECRRRADRWAELTEQFQKRLERLRRAAFLKDVNPAKPDAAALMAVSRHPAYSRFDQIARHILSPRIALGGEPDKKLCLRHTYEIYEFWCFFSVVEAMKKALPEVEWHSNIKTTTGTLLLNIENGSGIQGKSGDTDITVVFQQTYGATKDADGLFSISKECVPDIVLTLRQEDRVRTIVFDAKYRSSAQSVHAALSDIHCYRDAIRCDADRSGVEAAFILTPAHHSDRGKYYREEYRHIYRFGGFDLLPNNSEQHNLLVKYLRQAVRG